MKKRSVLLLVLVCIAFVIVSMSFVSAYEVGGQEGYCTTASKDIAYVYKTTIGIVGYKDFSRIQTEGMYCKTLPSGISINTAQTSNVFLTSLNSQALCPPNYIAYGFMCDTENDGTPSDCQYDNKIRLYCVNLSGNYVLTYWTTSFHLNFLDCSNYNGYIAGLYSYSDTTKLKVRCVNITACTLKTCADYPGQCGTLSDGCGTGGTIICICPDASSSSWKNSSGTSITNISSGQTIILSIAGANLLGVNISYIIYNSTQKIVYISNHSALNANSDSITWTPSIAGNYKFNATLLLGGKSILSENLLVILSCADECSEGDWKLECSGNNVNKTICENYDGDSCLEYGDSTLNKTCSASQICSIGLCTDVVYISPESCFSYDSQSKCGNFNISVAKKDIDNYILSSFNIKAMPASGFCETNNIIKSVALFNGICNYTAINCKCSWNTNGIASCGKAFDLKRTCANSSGTSEAVGQCDISIAIENKCGSPGGKILQKSTAVWKVLSGDKTYKPEKGVCESKTTEYPCPSAQKLPFFNFWNFILSLSLIAVIYAVLNKRN